MSRNAETFPATSMPDRDWWAELWPDPQKVLRALSVTADMTVLDLCCGDGLFTGALATLVEGKVIALDIDCKMIEQAQAEVAKVGASVHRWICADAMELASHISDPVDFVLIGNTFHGVPDKAGLLRSARSVMRPQGLLGIINWYPAKREDTPVLGQPRGPRSDMRMAPEAIAAIAAQVGFRRRDIIDLPPYHYGALLEAVAFDTSR